MIRRAPHALHATRVVLALLVATAPARGRADEPPEPRATPGASGEPGDWSGRSAIPAARHAGEVALLAESRLGVGRDVQLGARALGAVAPQLTILHRLLARDGLQVATRFGVMYPTPMLAFFTGDGAMALLPGDTTPPHALILSAGARVTHVRRHQLVTAEVALVVAPRFTRTNSPALDFPFLYSRFGVLDAPLGARASILGEGVIRAGWRWRAGVDGFWVPVVRGGFVLEPHAALGHAFRRRATLELGFRAAWGRYPVGLRLHMTPTADLRIAF